MTTEEIFRQFFYSWPFSEPKPPSSAFGILSEDKKKFIGIEIQFAVAGFEKEDLTVHNEGRTISVVGDNTKREGIADKFRCAFSRKISLLEILDIENATVDLKNGILSIRVMSKEPEKTKKKLF